MKRSKLPLRDRLSLERTYLSIERTLLAYLRTFVGLIAAGAALLKLFDVSWAHAAGLALLILSPLVLFFGLWRFIHTHLKLRHVTPDEEEEIEDED